MLEFLFRHWLIRNQINSIFYQGHVSKDDDAQTRWVSRQCIYCLLTDWPELGKDVRQCPAISSDLQQINANAFSWFETFLPEVQAIPDANARLYWKRIAKVGYDLRWFNLEAPELILRLITNIFQKNPKVLQAAMNMCTLSLTTEHWKQYEEEHAKWLQSIQRLPDTQKKHAILEAEKQEEAWGCDFSNRIKLLDEPALEVLLFHSDGFVPMQNANGHFTWHVDDLNTCFAASNLSEKANYGVAHIHLPGPRAGYDRVAIEVSGLDGIWPAPANSTKDTVTMEEHDIALEAGVFLPSNVLYRDVGPLPTDDTDPICQKECYIIQMCANGMPAAIQPGEFYYESPKCLRPIRLKLSELREIERQLHEEGSAGNGLDASLMPAAELRNPYTIDKKNNVHDN